MLSQFFLKRPVFAWVIAIVIMAAGVLGIHNLPISQYPNMAPPSISISATYPGASAKTVENSVTQIIEQKMTGFENLIYMSSTSDSSGSSRIELTFAAGTDPDVAWSKVQNKLQLAMTSLPTVVTNQGVTVNKSTRNYLMIVGLVSEDGSMDKSDLSDYASSNLQSILARIPGVGEVSIFGSEYSMKIWLNPVKMTNYGLTVSEVLTALKSYNVEVSAGQFGGLPAVNGQRLNASIVVQNMLATPEEFGKIPVRITSSGSRILIKDIARVELAGASEDIVTRQNGKPSTGIAIRNAPGANALDTADAVKAKLASMQSVLPKGMKVVYPLDTTPFIKVAIEEVVKTLVEAIFLVFIIMWLFMGNIRATLIPTIAVPIVLLGTFAVLSFFGYSINMLTMFAMVLAIGLLVDDAIVVVENVERIMSEEGLSPREATAKSMTEITSALIGIGLVLSAVFGPMAFFSGSTGVLYRQFSITIVTAMMLSVVVALILTPVLCATLLKPVKAGHEPSENAIFFLRPFFRAFDKMFFGLRDSYIKLVRRSLSKKPRYIFIFLLIVGLMGFLYMRMPTSFLPDEDQGSIMVQVKLPTGSTMEQTEKIASQVREYFLNKEKNTVESCMEILGYGFSGRAQNTAMMFVKLKDWDLRTKESQKVKSLIGRAMGYFSTINKAVIFAFAPPAVMELGTANGFDFQLLDQGGLGHEALTNARNQLLGMMAKDPRVTRLRPNGMEDVPEYRIDVDWEKAGTLGLNISDIHSAISTFFGSSYVNNFVLSGRIKRVYAQADAMYRMNPNDLRNIYVKNNKNEMVPFSSFAVGRWVYGSPRLERFNGFASMNLQGNTAPGVSSGDAMKAMEEAVAKLPTGIGYEWSGLSYQEKKSGSQTVMLYGFSIFVIFLCLAALYESWSIPIAILIILPLGAIGGIIATSIRGLSNDVYFQIGFLITLGLTTKNAILIVQFARDEFHKGKSLVEAAIDGARLRFRPILMTSLAFGFGVVPLATSTGAGAGAQIAIGTSVLGGMVTATILVVIFAPFFYVLIAKLMLRRKNPDDRIISKLEY